MHKLVGAHQGNAFLLENAADLLPVGKDDLNLLAFLKVFAAGLSLCVAVDHGAGFISQAGCREAGLLKHGIRLNGGKGKSCLLVHFPDRAFPVVLSLFNQAGRKFINETSEGEPVLTDQDDPVFFGRPGPFFLHTVHT